VTPLRHLDLFSGIGGFALGLERAGLSHPVGFVEIDPLCRRVLEKHWPSVPVHDDVTTREFIEGEADVITGGFPCQDVSLAGKRAGLAGARSGLYRELIRAIRMVRPRFVIMENSPGLLDSGLGDILGEMAAIGYDAEWSVLSACALGFPHTRERLFIVAYPEGEWRQQRRRLKFSQNGDCARDIYQRFSEPEPARMAYGVSERMDRLSALGNAVVPQVVEVIGRALRSRLDGVA